MEFEYFGGSVVENKSNTFLISSKFYHFRKSSGDGYVQVFQIKANKKKDKARTNYISIEGTCCWVIENRHGETEELGLGESKIPKIAYISTLKTKKC